MEVLAMRECVKIMPKKFYSLVLMVSIGAAIFYGTASASDSTKKGSEVKMPAEKKEVSAKEGNGCEILACIGEIKGDCEMSIGIMRNTDPAIQSDFDETHVQIIEKAVTVQFLKDWPPDSTTIKKPCFGKDDKVSYKKYKNKESEYHVSHFDASFAIPRKMTLDQKIGECDFTYGELLKAVEGLEHQDKAQLGKETILVKSREFKQLPDKAFFQGPIKREPY